LLSSSPNLQFVAYFPHAGQDGLGFRLIEFRAGAWFVLGLFFFPEQTDCLHSQVLVLEMPVYPRAARWFSTQSVFSFMRVCWRHDVVFIHTVLLFRWAFSFFPF